MQRIAERGAELRAQALQMYNPDPRQPVIQIHHHHYYFGESNPFQVTLPQQPAGSPSRPAPVASQVVHEKPAKTLNQHLAEALLRDSELGDSAGIRPDEGQYPVPEPHTSPEHAHAASGRTRPHQHTYPQQTHSPKTLTPADSVKSSGAAAGVQVPKLALPQTEGTAWMPRNVQPSRDVDPLDDIDLVSTSTAPGREAADIASSLHSARSHPESDAGGSDADVEAASVFSDPYANHPERSRHGIQPHARRDRGTRPAPTKAPARRPLQLTQAAQRASAGFDESEEAPEPPCTARILEKSPLPTPSSSELLYAPVNPHRRQKKDTARTEVGSGVERQRLDEATKKRLRAKYEQSLKNAQLQQPSSSSLWSLDVASLKARHAVAYPLLQLNGGPSEVHVDDVRPDKQTRTMFPALELRVPNRKSDPGLVQIREPVTGNWVTVPAQPRSYALSTLLKAYWAAHSGDQQGDDNEPPWEPSRFPGQEAIEEYINHELPQGIITFPPSPSQRRSGEAFGEDFIETPAGGTLPLLRFEEPGFPVRRALRNKRPHRLDEEAPGWPPELPIRRVTTGLPVQPLELEPQEGPVKPFWPKLLAPSLEPSGLPQPQPGLPQPQAPHVSGEAPQDLLREKGLQPLKLGALPAMPDETPFMLYDLRSLPLRVSPKRSSRVEGSSKGPIQPLHLESPHVPMTDSDMYRPPVQPLDLGGPEAIQVPRQFAQPQEYTDLPTFRLHQFGDSQRSFVGPPQEPSAPQGLKPLQLGPPMPLVTTTTAPFGSLPQQQEPLASQSPKEHKTTAEPLRFVLNLDQPHSRVSAAPDVSELSSPDAESFRAMFAAATQVQRPIGAELATPRSDAMVASPHLSEISANGGIATPSTLSPLSSRSDASVSLSDSSLLMPKSSADQPSVKSPLASYVSSSQTLPSNPPLGVSSTPIHVTPPQAPSYPQQASTPGVPSRPSGPAQTAPISQGQRPPSPIAVSSQSIIPQGAVIFKLQRTYVPTNVNSEWDQQASVLRSQDDARQASRNRVQSEATRARFADEIARDRRAIVDQIVRNTR